VINQSHYGRITRSRKNKCEQSVESGTDAANPTDGLCAVVAASRASFYVVFSYFNRVLRIVACIFYIHQIVA